MWAGGGVWLGMLAIFYFFFAFPNLIYFKVISLMMEKESDPQPVLPVVSFYFLIFYFDPFISNL